MIYEKHWQTYRILASRKDDVEKKLQRVKKKADRYNAPLSWDWSIPYMDRVQIITVAPDRTESSEFVELECIDLHLYSNVIRKGNYKVIAKIEHAQTETQVANIVTMTDHAQQLRPAWIRLKPYCEHCHSNHNLKYTFIVRDERGYDTQVGRSCLKEYCGIDPQIIGIWNELVALVYEETDASMWDMDVIRSNYAYGIEDVLANAIEIYKQYGYVRSSERNSNKERLAEAMRHNRIPDMEICDIAADMREFMVNMSFEEACEADLAQVWSLCINGYCKPEHYGYMAYAPIAIKKYQDKLERQRKHDEAVAKAREASSWVGNVGERVDVDITSLKLVTSWDTEYGRTYLYKFEDVSGNLFVWYASKQFGATMTDKWGCQYLEPFGSDDVATIRATVKDHTEYEGVKQTVLTRVKAIKLNEVKKTA